MLSMLRAAGLFTLVLSGDVHADNLLVSTWGGVYGETYNSEVLEPFGSAQGVQIEHTVDHRRDADATELSLHEAIRGCESGELMMLPPAALEVLSSVHSYIPNAIQPCAVGQWSWATVVGFGGDAFRANDARPALISDFFNTIDFPGKRVLRRSPRVIAEWALAASGVPANQIYLALTSVDEVWPVIEKQIRQIENEVIWVDSDSEALAYLRDGIASFAMLSTSGVVREAISLASAPNIIWDAAVVELSMLAIPSDAENPELSLQLLHYISESANTLPFAAALGLSPVEFETARLLNSEYRKYLPAEPANFDNAIWGDSVWWQSAGGSKMVDLFSAWVERVSSMQSLVMVDPAEIVNASRDIFQSPGSDELNVENNF